MRNPVHSPPRRRPAIAGLLLAALLAAPLASAVAAPAPGVDTAWRAKLPAADRALYDRLCARIEAAYDSSRGYTAKDGMPSESAIEAALWNGLSEPDGYWNAHAGRSLRWMFTLYDSAMTGFYHGQTDAHIGSSNYAK